MNRRKTGTAYEEIAASYLREEGVRILRKNYRTRQGEVDLVGEDTSHLIFVEVKYRKNQEYGDPCDSVSYYKQRKICRVAMGYLYRYPTSKQVRYDVISICGDKIQWIRDAFEHVGYF